MGMSHNKFLTKAMFGCCKTFSGKYIFSGKAFPEKENISMCLVAFQKIFRKIFSGVWKRRRKTQPRKNSNTVQILPLGSLAGARDRDQQRDLAVARSRSTARSREGEIAIYRSSSRISRSSSTDLPLGSLAGAISQRRDRDQRRDLTVTRSRSSHLLSRASALSLFLSLSFSHFPEML